MVVEQIIVREMQLILLICLLHRVRSLSVMPSHSRRARCGSFGSRLQKRPAQKSRAEGKEPSLRLRAHSQQNFDSSLLKKARSVSRFYTYTKIKINSEYPLLELNGFTN